MKKVSKHTLFPLTNQRIWCTIEIGAEPIGSISLAAYAIYFLSFVALIGSTLIFFITGGLPMDVDVRTPNGKKLFEWNPETKTITIVSKKHRYQVELKDEAGKPDYKVSEQKQIL